MRLILQKILEGGIVEHTDLQSKQQQARSHVSCSDKSDTAVDGEKIFTAFMVIIVGVGMAALAAAVEKCRARKV